MKSMELSNEQRTKLMEMISILFPEIASHDMNKFDLRDGDRDLPAVMWNSGDHNWQSIHWFEFCMTHLVEKILNPKPRHPQRGLSDTFKDFYWNMNLYWFGTIVSDKGIISSNITDAIHPIDYLYKIFKKLK